MPDATTRAGILAKEGVISYYFRPRNVILAFLVVILPNATPRAGILANKRVKNRFSAWSLYSRARP